MGETGPVNAAPDAGWSDWRRVRGITPLSSAVLAEILDGGQAFRWNRDHAGIWTGIWADQVVRLCLNAGGELVASAPLERVNKIEQDLGRYLATDVDFAAVTDALPWRSDPHLARCVADFRGLRILRQPLGETLLGFLCSATKQIVQIKQMLALLAEQHGKPIAAPALPANRLPTWDELANIPEAALRQCLLGFRAKYISQTAHFLQAHPGWLAETESLPYAEAKARLCLLPGVGEKVADCVVLFGAGRPEAFPVDVWILKTLAARYGLTGWRPAQLAQFGRAHFGPAAGLAQQYLFAWERAAARNSKTETRNPKQIRRSENS